MCWFCSSFHNIKLNIDKLFVDYIKLGKTALLNVQYWYTCLYTDVVESQSKLSFKIPFIFFTNIIEVKTANYYKLSLH